MSNNLRQVFFCPKNIFTGMHYCDIEKISNIDIEKKIPVISIFSIFFCCEIIRMKLGFLFREKH